ncbi:MAG TPA: ZIP family metal transporter [Candidatus Nanoarchaeia archaeon]|nr:ZIP family metal transporter [Candidatus Nanoarchaeia archaeon]
MSNNILYPLLAGIIAACVTTIGIYIMNKYSGWGKKNIVYFMAFAAGILIPISFLHLIPKSFEMSSYAPLFLLGGFLLLHFLNRFLDLFVCKHSETCDHKFGLIPAIGIGLHSLVDGIIFSVTFTVSVFTGIISAIGMILHELPEGVISFIFLHKSGYSKKKSSLYAFLAAAISTPIGVLISWPFINSVSQSTLGVLVSLSAGALIYVGATHLLPHVEEERGRYSLLALGIGILVAVLITIL